MPLDKVAEQYADQLFTKRMDELARDHGQRIRTINADFAKRGLASSGPRMQALVAAGIEHAEEVAQARVESLLLSHKKGGSPFDQQAVEGIINDVAQICEVRKGSLLQEIALTIRRANLAIPALDEALQRQIDQGFSSVLARVRLDLTIKLSEAALEAREVARAASSALSSGVDSPSSANDLPNREDLLTDINSALQAGKTLSVVFIDLDGFKLINDSLGHQAGDKCLDTVVKVASEAIHSKGKMYRYGGDEFVVVLPNFNSTEAQGTAERIKAAIEGLGPAGDLRVTASIGVVCSDQTQSGTAEDLVNFADHAMYNSKQSGGNRVTAHTTSAGSEQILPKRTPGDIPRRVEAVELSISLRQAVSQNYIVLVKNESGEEVSIRKLTLERNGLELSQPTIPKEGEEWMLAPRSGRQLAWDPTPDPVVTLQMSQSPPTSPIDIEIVLLCQILGMRKEFKRKILVAADYRNHRLDSLSSW